MKATKLASEVSSKVSVPFSVGQPVRIRLGILTGFFGTLVGLPTPGRALIELQRGIYLEIDQSSLELQGWGE